MNSKKTLPDFLEAFFLFVSMSSKLFYMILTHQKKHNNSSKNAHSREALYFTFASCNNNSYLIKLSFVTKRVTII